MSTVTYFPETVDVNEGTATIRFGAFGYQDFVDGYVLTCDPDPPTVGDTFATAHGLESYWDGAQTVLRLADASIDHYFIVTTDADAVGRRTPDTVPGGLISDATNTYAVTVNWTGRMRVLPHSNVGIRTDDTPNPAVTANVTIKNWIRRLNFELGMWEDLSGPDQIVPVSGDWSTYNTVLSFTSVYLYDEVHVQPVLTLPTGVTSPAHWDLDLGCAGLVITGPDLPNLSGDLRGVRVRFS